MHNVLTITGLELRQRMRSTRWKWTLAALFTLMSAVVFGSWYLYSATASGVDSFGRSTYEQWSAQLFTIALYAVLFVGLIGAPTLSATSINGDRRDATLAVLQATPITSWQLAAGKLIGSWLASLSFIVIAAPYLIWGLFSPAQPVAGGLLSIAVTALLLLAYCAVGLGISALTPRPAASAVGTQAVVLMLLIGLPAIFGLLLPSVEEEHRVPGTHYDYPAGTSWEDPEAQPVCQDVMDTRTYQHTEHTWWLLAPNPLLIVADTATTGFDDHRRTGRPGVFETATMLAFARSGPFMAGTSCADWASRYSSVDDEQLYADFEQRSAARKAHEHRYIGDSWYYGLAFTLLLGAAGFLIAGLRLRVPAGKLPRGVRIA